MPKPGADDREAGEGVDKLREDGRLGRGGETPDDDGGSGVHFADDDAGETGEKGPWLGTTVLQLDDAGVQLVEGFQIRAGRLSDGLLLLIIL